MRRGRYDMDDGELYASDDVRGFADVDGNADGRRRDSGTDGGNGETVGDGGNADSPEIDVKPIEKQRSKVSEFLISVLSGNILSKSEVTRAYPYMVFVCILAFIYMASMFRTQYLYRERNALMEEVKELRARSMTIASHKMTATRQSVIISELKKRNIPLEESLKPNKIIPRQVK